MWARVIPAVPRRKRRPPKLRRRPRSRRSSSALRPLRVAQLGESTLVDSEVVRELVKDGDTDLVLEPRGVVAEVCLEREPVNGHLGRHVGSFLEEAEDLRVVGVLLLHDDSDVLEAAREVGRERVECLPDAVLEAGHQYAGCRGRRCATSFTVRNPKANPPMWAKTATPPVWSGCVKPAPPCQICRPIQMPRNQTARISRKMKKKISVSTRARGSSTKYAPSTAAIAPLAPMFGMLASCVVPKCRVTTDCVAIAATPAARYQSRKRTLPSASSTLLPKIQRKSMFPRMCSQPPCMNIDVNVLSSHPRLCATAWPFSTTRSHGPWTEHG